MPQSGDDATANPLIKLEKENSSRQIKLDKIESMAKKFAEERLKSEEAWFERILNTSLILFVFGLVFVILSEWVFAGDKHDDFSSTVISKKVWISSVLKGLGAIGVCCAVFGASLCPYRVGEYGNLCALKWDEIMEERRKWTWDFATFVAGCLTVADVYTFHHLQYGRFTCGLAVLPCLYSLFSSFLHRYSLVAKERFMVLPSSTSFWWLVITIGGLGPVAIELQSSQYGLNSNNHYKQKQHCDICQPWPKSEKHAYIVSGSIRIFCAVLAVIIWYTVRRNSHAWADTAAWADWAVTLEKPKPTNSSDLYGRIRAFFVDFYAPDPEEVRSLRDEQNDLSGLEKLKIRKRNECGTAILFFAVYYYLSVTGACQIIDGAASIYIAPEIDDAKDQKDVYTWSLVYLIEGCLLSLPSLVLLGVKREKLYKWLQRRFEAENKQASKDGAFVAEMLASVTKTSFEEYWVMRDKADERYSNERERYWRRGQVVKGNDATHINVELPVRARHDDLDGPKWNVSRGSFTFFERPSMQVKGRTEIIPVEIELSRGANGGSIEEGAGAGTGVDVVCNGMNSADLLKEAESNLRCITWENLVKHREELMGGAIEGASKPTEADKAEWWNMGQPVEAGQTIDFFMSHSWSDDRDAKWAALERVANEFKNKEGRFPTFWLDKVGINQKRVAEGLKVLPINVHACDTMLVLCGATYAKRLWCIWELFVLLAFSDAEDAAENKIKFCTLHGSEDDALDRLKNFHLADAACFDPNEENRLRHVIKSRGVDDFETRIRDTAKAIQDRRQRSESRDLTNTVSAAASAVDAVVGRRNAPSTTTASMTARLAVTN